MPLPYHQSLEPASKQLGEDPETVKHIFRQSEEEAAEVLKLISPEIADIIREQEKKQDETWGGRKPFLLTSVGRVRDA